MYPKAELLFPPRMIPLLRGLRGPEWASLVERVMKLPEIDPDSLAFTLMMVRLDGCVKCHEGSFKYMRGCQLCATQTVMQFKGSDSDLTAMYNKARRDVDAFLAGEAVPEEEESDESEPIMEEE
ncbi:MAG: hypothetical protein FJ011_08330 [Chloroflexi bacterium]|nr:hypothetical protein [Chloroflexota bacterium]